MPYYRLLSPLYYIRTIHIAADLDIDFLPQEILIAFVDALAPVFGIELNEEENKKRGQETLISTPNSKIKVFVIPTNEEVMIARDTAKLLNL